MNAYELESCPVCDGFIMKNECSYYNCFYGKSESEKKEVKNEII